MAVDWQQRQIKRKEKISTKQISKQIKHDWNKMSAQEKARYEELSRSDRERHQTDKVTFEEDQKAAIEQEYLLEIRNLDQPLPSNNTLEEHFESRDFKDEDSMSCLEAQPEPLVEQQYRSHKEQLECQSITQCLETALRGTKEPKLRGKQKVKRASAVREEQKVPSSTQDNSKDQQQDERWSEFQMSESVHSRSASHLECSEILN